MNLSVLPRLKGALENQCVFSMSCRLSYQVSLEEVVYVGSDVHGLLKRFSMLFATIIPDISLVW